jgi:hypothetical protein
MKKALAAFLLISMASLGLAADAGSWTGVLTDSKCGEKGASAEHASCAVKCVEKQGAKWALWDPKAKQLYELVDAKDAAKMAGKEVTVKGSLADKKITVTSMEAAAK